MRRFLLMSATASVLLGASVCMAQERFPSARKVKAQSKATTKPGEAKPLAEPPAGGQEEPLPMPPPPELAPTSSSPAGESPDPEVPSIQGFGLDLRSQEAPARDSTGCFSVGLKAGGLLAFSKLDASARATLELGYVLPFAQRNLSVGVEVSYAAPKRSGVQHGDVRVGGSYSWRLSVQELTIMPVAFYRLPISEHFIPYIGAGPRIYLLRSTTSGDVNGVPISETREQSTKLGIGIPIGVQVRLGPGFVLAELLTEYGPLDHTTTGGSNTGAESLQLGYRLQL